MLFGCVPKVAMGMCAQESSLAVDRIYVSGMADWQADL